MEIESILFEFLKENKSWFVTNMIFILINYPFEIIILSYISSKILIEIVNIKNNWHMLKIHIILFILFYVILEIFAYFKEQNDSRMVPKFESYVRNKIIAKLYSKNEVNCSSIKSGELIQRLMKIPPAISEVYERFNHYVIPFVVTIVSIVIYFLIVDFKIGFVSLSLLIIYAFIYLHYANNSVSLSQIREREETLLYEDIEDTMNNIFTIFCTNQQDFEKKRRFIYDKKFNEIFEKEMITNTTLKLSTGLMNIFIFSIIIIFTLIQYQKNQISAIKTVSIITICVFLIKQFRNTSRRVSESMIHYGTIKDCNGYMKQLKHQIINNGNANNFFKNGKIVFNNVSFKYPMSNQYSLKNVTFNVDRNENVAIIGHSGSGKSTILKLIMGFYNLESGSITIDNTDMSNINRKYLRSKISYINQDTRLFNRPIIENIVYGTKYSEKDAIEIVKKLEIAKVISNKNLYDYAGKLGDNLSGGQKQMINLIRCYLSDASIVLLDEPTSAIDQHHKQYVIDMIKKLMKNKTVILVTHDPELATLFNKVIYMQHGNIIKIQQSSLK